MDINPIRLSDYWVLTKNPLRPILPKNNISKFNLALLIKKKHPTLSVSWGFSFSVIFSASNHVLIENPSSFKVSEIPHIFVISLKSSSPQKAHLVIFKFYSFFFLYIHHFALFGLWESERKERKNENLKLLSSTPTLSIQENTSKPRNIHNHSIANSHFSLLIPISHFKNCKLIKTKSNKGWRLKEVYFVMWKLKKSAKCFLWSCSERLFHRRIGGGKKRKREDIWWD